MSFAGSNGSRSRSASRSPYHERAKASSSSSRSPGPPPPPPKSQSFFINVQPRGMRPETAAAVPRNLLYSNQSPARSPSKGASSPLFPFFFLVGPGPRLLNLKNFSKASMLLSSLLIFFVHNFLRNNRVLCILQQSWM
jgi:hypothetical protein